VERHTPVQVQNLDGVTAVALGHKHSLALKNDGTVWAWGENLGGALGDGSTFDRHTPVQVGRSHVLFPFHLTGVTAIAAGVAYSLALKGDGTVWAWGVNSFGKLGVPTHAPPDFHSLPVQAGPHVSEVRAIAAGASHTLALGRDAILQAWGENIDGELGNGIADSSDHGYPTQVVGLVENLSEVTAIAGGLSHSLAAGALSTLLTIRKNLVHPDQTHLRRFVIMIDGVVVAGDINAGQTPPQRVSPGIHTVTETGGTDTSLSDFTTVIGGDCAADGTVSLALGDKKTCTITNYDLSGGCLPGAICCEPGEGVHGCTRCVAPPQPCP
jgi:alpha-tubulin suppressor-like RCC1 family protein